MALNERTGGASGEAERDSRLERLYREAARDEPPAHLDAAILAAARREAGAGPRALATKLRRWHVPVSIAAVVVVSVSLVILMQEEESRPDRAIAIPKVPPIAAEPATPPARSVVPEVAKEAAREPHADFAGARREVRDDKEAVTRSALPARSRSEPAPPAPAATGIEEMRSSKQLAQPSPAAAPAGANELAAPPPSDAVTTGRMADAPAAAAGAQADLPSTEALRAAPLAGAMAKRSIEQDRPPVWQGFEKQPPEKWLARIAELKAQSREQEAQEMLAEFKRRFPDHPLPATLR